MGFYLGLRPWNLALPFWGLAWIGIPPGQAVSDGAATMTVVAGRTWSVGLLQLAANFQQNVVNIESPFWTRTRWTGSAASTSGAAWGLGAGLWRVTWRMLGGGSTAGPVHPNLTACAHAHPAPYLRPCCRNPDRRQACLDLASELMDPSALLPAALPSTGTWGFCHPSFSPTCPPAHCRYFRGFAALWLWLTYHKGNFRKGSGALRGFTCCLSSALMGCCSGRPWPPCSLV